MSNLFDEYTVSEMEDYYRRMRDRLNNLPEDSYYRIMIESSMEEAENELERRRLATWWKEVQEHTRTLTGGQIGLLSKAAYDDHLDLDPAEAAWQVLFEHDLVGEFDE